MKSFHQFLKVFLMVLLTIQILNANGLKNSKSIKAFPPLYDFDDYDACLYGGETTRLGSTYCMIYAEIKPQNSSKLWREISQHIAEYKFHYRRDRLFFGVCMQHCKKFPKILDHSVSNDSKITNQITQFFDVVHKRPLDLQIRSAYHDLVYNCLNSKFQHKFGLSLQTHIEYCENSEAVIKQDAVEKIIYKFLEIILILNLLSSVYDYCLKRKQPVDFQNENFYKINPQQPVSRLLTAFSVRRNYYRLIEPYTTQLGRDLSYLDGVRSLSVITVVIGHTFFVQYHHVKNPDTFEKSAKNALHLFFLNGTLILEVFHVLSGLLLLIKFNYLFSINSHSSLGDCAKTFFKGMLLRYMRFLPSLLFFISVNASVFTHLQNGPFWRHLTEPGRTFAREKWLKNLLIFDNISESGFPHTWYLTTDWQLFAFYFSVIIAINKYPQYKIELLSTLAVFSILIPFSISYYYSLAPCYLISPESFRFTHVNEEEEFFKLYTPFYTNLGGYLFGIVCGEIYKKFRHNEEFCKKLSARVPMEIFELAFWCCIASGVWIDWLGTIVVFKEPSIWTALYAGLNRNLFLVTFGSGFILLGMFCKSLSVMNFLNHTWCRILARLSFQIYLWHFPILYLINGHKRDPVYANHLNHLTLIIGFLSLTFAVGFMITLLVEYPFHQIANFYYKKSNRPKADHLKS